MLKSSPVRKSNPDPKGFSGSGRESSLMGMARRVGHTVLALRIFDACVYQGRRPSTL